MSSETASSNVTSSAVDAGLISTIEPIRTPLPKLQVFLTLIIQTTEPITASVIYPFIVSAVRDSGITQGDEKKTGYFAGVIESVFFFSECLSVFQWGKASDAYGRRPVILLGPLGLSLAMLGFGLTKSFWSMVVFRAIQGVFNGNIGVAKTAMAELTDHTNRVDVFTFLPIMWSSGVTLGPAIGGVLASPATRWPKVFGGITFFVQHPFFLPCAVAGLLAFLVFVLSYVGFKETSSKFITAKKQRRLSDDESCPLISTHDEQRYNATNTHPRSDHASRTEAVSSSPSTTSFIDLLGSSSLRITLLNHAFLAFTDISYTVLIPLIYSTSIPVGGLGFSPYQLGITMGVYGFSIGMLNILVLKHILKKLGPRRTYILSYSTLFIDFIMFWVLREAAAYYGRVNGVVWVLIVVQLMLSSFLNLAWNSTSLLFISSAPLGGLGATNGLAQMVSSGMRCLGPIFASSIFSISLETRLGGGHLVEIIMLGVVLVGISCSLKLPKRLDSFETAFDS